MAVQFYLFPRALKSGEHAISISVSVSNTRLQTTIGISVNPNSWMDSRQRVKKTATNAKGMLASEINEKLAAIEKAFQDFEIENEFAPVEKNKLKDILALAMYGKVIPRTKKETIDFYTLFQNIVDSEKVECQWAESTLKKYMTFKAHLQAFSPKVHFSEWSEVRLNEFVAFEAAELQMKNVSIQKDLKMLKWFFRRAAKRGAKIPTDYVDYKPKFKLVDKEIVFLTWKELLKFYHFNFPEEGIAVPLKDMRGKRYDKVVTYRSSLEKVRDLFCFCAFTGLRYSDMAQLKRTDIRKDHFKIVTEKTNCSLSVPFNDYSMAIIKKYEREKYPYNLALPVISNQKMNDYLKDALELCGFNTPVKYTFYRGGTRYEEIHPKWEVLGTHGGRRTFICNALAKGISPSVIMKITGHANYAAMKPYIEITDTTKREAMNSFSFKTK